MPSPMPSMLTTLTEKMDTSPSRVAATRTARVGMTPPSATSSGMPPATSPPSSSTMMTMAMGSAMASPRSRSDSDAVWNVSPDQDAAPDQHLGRVQLPGEVLDPVGDRELVVLGRGCRRG